MFLESNYARRLQSAKYTREKVVESRSAILEVDGASSNEHFRYDTERNDA